MFQEIMNEELEAADRRNREFTQAAILQAIRPVDMILMMLAFCLFVICSLSVSDYVCVLMHVCVCW